MRVLAQPAYVLHARPWRETSVIVELLTRDHGRVGVVARGLTTAKRHPLKAALQPLQFVRVDYEQRGELARLRQAEALDHPPALQGERLMAMFYVNELLLRLTPRNDAAQALFKLYARVRGELGGDDALAWTLHDLGRIEEAAAWSIRALARSRTPERLLQVGWMCQRLELFQQAAARYFYSPTASIRPRE